MLCQDFDRKLCAEFSPLDALTKHIGKHLIQFPVIVFNRIRIEEALTIKHLANGLIRGCRNFSKRRRQPRMVSSVSLISLEIVAVDE